MVAANNNVQLKETLQQILSVTKIDLDVKDGALDLGEVLDGLKERHIIDEKQHEEMLKMLEL